MDDWSMATLRDGTKVPRDEYYARRKVEQELMRELVGKYTLDGYRCIHYKKLDGAEYPAYLSATFVKFNGYTRNHILVVNACIPDWGKDPIAIHGALPLEMIVNMADYIRDGVDWELEDPKEFDFYNKHGYKYWEEKRYGNSKSKTDGETTTAQGRRQSGGPGTGSTAGDDNEHLDPSDDGAGSSIQS